MEALNCEQAGQWISLKIDGEPLPGRAGTVLDEHLTACAACRSFLAQESRRSAQLGAALAGEDNSAVLASSILEQLRRAGNESPSVEPFLWRPVAFRAAAAALVLVAAVFAGRLFLPAPPSGPAVTAPDIPLTYVVEEQVDDVHVVPDADGSPVRQDVERVRRFTFPAGTNGDPRLSAPGDGRGMGLERFKTRAVRLVSWPIR